MNVTFAMRKTCKILIRIAKERFELFFILNRQYAVETTGKMGESENTDSRNVNKLFQKYFLRILSDFSIFY